VKAFDAAGGTVVCAAEQGARPPEVYEVVGGSMEALTSFHDGFVVETGSREPDYVGAVAEDGTGIDCWVLRPPEDVELIGAVLYVPGGMAQWGWDYNHDMQVLASAGIAVIFGNARGSGGYSEAWARAICGPHSRYPSTGWCGVDATDMLSIVSAVLAAVPAIDRGRVAVMGGSYGGLMAAYLGFTTDVFAAVIAERGPFNLTAMAATSDEGMWLFEGCIGGTALEEPEQYAASSVMSYVEGAHTPVLIIHSEDDLRCPVQQAEELFTALRRADQDVTFVRFPGESHELSRSGGPVHRVQRAQIIRDWLVARLTGGVAAFEMEG
jgi:dipeptidyl aminopeptidase/acylaminoacyl peptidase